MTGHSNHKGASREAFERYQRERPLMLRKFATLLEVWRFCGDKSCLRAKACIGPHGAQCAGIFMQAMPDEERAAFHLALELRLAGAGPEAAWGEAQRTIAERMRQGGVDG